MGGEAGLQEIAQVAAILQELGVKTNRSAGCHVHIDAADIDLQGLKGIAQNFLKYEDAFDLVVPRSRRGGTNRFCNTNVRNSQLATLTSRAKHDRLEGCATVDELIRLVSPSRYHKLNMQNLTGPKRTLEFRQHGATCSGTKLKSWIALLLSFVEKSASRPPCKVFRASRTPK